MKIQPNHYYIEIAQKITMRDDIELNRIYILLDASDLNNLGSPINIYDKDRLVNVDTTNKADYQLLCNMLVNNHVFSINDLNGHSNKWHELDIDNNKNGIVAYGYKDETTMHVIDYSVSIDYNDDEYSLIVYIEEETIFTACGLSDFDAYFFNVEVVATKNKELEHLMAKLNLSNSKLPTLKALGDDLHITDTIKEHTNIYMIYAFIKKAFRARLTTSRIDLIEHILTHDTNLIELHFRNNKEMKTIEVNKIQIGYKDTFLMLTDKLMIKANTVEFKCDTWLMSNNAIKKLYIRAGEIRNSHLIKYLKNVSVGSSSIDNMKLFDMRGIESEDHFENSKLQGIDILIINTSINNIAKDSIHNIGTLFTNNSEILYSTQGNNYFNEIVVYGIAFEQNESDVNKFKLYDRVATKYEIDTYNLTY